VQPNTVCNCIYIHTNITTYFITHPPYLNTRAKFFFEFYLRYSKSFKFIFKNSNMLDSQFQWLFLAEGQIM